ncbi:MAG: glycoside hydrolase family 113 [Bradymonadia bacterium]
MYPRLALLIMLALGTHAHAQGEVVHGVTISCQTYGPEWGTDAFAAELDRLKAMGVNWVAIHPYARIDGDGRVSTRLDSSKPPRWITRPIAEAKARGMHIMVKPHLAYWGSPFSWRGEIDFPPGPKRDRFFESYRRWIVDMAQVTAEADAFAVGTELDKLIEHDAQWRRIIAEIRKVTPAKLTYAANWTDYTRVPFWDALDAVGVQAYFPLMKEGDGAKADRATLLAGWQKVLDGLREVHTQTGKPIIFTELGYSLTPVAATKPWAHEWPKGWGDKAAAAALQKLCLDVALEVMEREKSWLRGAFLWKWFVGAAPGEDFMMDAPHLLPVLTEHWQG